MQCEKWTHFASMGVCVCVCVCVCVYRGVQGRTSITDKDRGRILTYKETEAVHSANDGQLSIFPLIVDDVVQSSVDHSHVNDLCSRVLSYREYCHENTSTSY